MNITYLVIHLFVDEFCLLLYLRCVWMLFFLGMDRPMRIEEKKTSWNRNEEFLLEEIAKNFFTNFPK